MNHQLPAYSRTENPYIFSPASLKPSNALDLPLYTSKNQIYSIAPSRDSYKIVKQPFGYFLGFFCYAASFFFCVLGFTSLIVCLFRFGNFFMIFGMIFEIICFGSFWFFFHNCIYEPDFISGIPKFKKFLPICLAIPSFHCFSGIISREGFRRSSMFWFVFTLSEILFGASLYAFFMGNDYSDYPLLFLKPWRYVKGRPVSQP
jgi:hypothetical protein